MAGRKYENQTLPLTSLKSEQSQESGKDAKFFQIPLPASRSY